jgi:hypothetical protein
MKGVAMPALEAVRASVGFDQLRAVGDSLYWLESRPESGTTTLVCWCPESGAADVTPPGFDVCSDVHAYGGGAFTAVDGGMWCVGGDGLYHVARAEVRPVTVGELALGDLAVGDGEILAVSESDAGDALVAVSLSEDRPKLRVLAEASGFFAAPRPGPGLLAWCWCHAPGHPPAAAPAATSEGCRERTLVGRKTHRATDRPRPPRPSWPATASLFRTP